MSRRAAVKPAIARAPEPPSRKLVRPAWASDRYNMSSATSERVATFAEHVSAGTYRLPIFQRPWRWSDSDVLALLTTLFGGGYVGTLLVWDRHGLAPSVERFDDVEVASNERRVRLVIDGQQRIGAIMTAVHSGRFFLDLRAGSFLVGEPGPWLCPVERIMGLRGALHGDGARWWFVEHAAAHGLPEDEVHDAWISAIEAMEIATIHLCVLDSGWALRDVVDTYKRLNTTGVKMSAEDLEAGLMRAGAT